MRIKKSNLWVDVYSARVERFFLEVWANLEQEEVHPLSRVCDSEPLLRYFTLEISKYQSINLHSNAIF